MDGSRKNMKQKDISTQNRRRLLSPQEVRGMEDALTPRPSTSTATSRPPSHLADTMKSRPKTAVKKSVCSNPPCALLRSKDPPLSEQDDNRGVDLANVIKLFGRLEKSKVPDIHVQDVDSEVQASYIPPSQLNTVPSFKESRSIGVSMDANMPSKFCGTKSGPCASARVEADTANATTGMEDPIQRYVEAASYKKVERQTGSVSPRRVLISQDKVPCEGKQGPCSTKGFKPSTQDKSTAAIRIRATSTPHYRNVPSNTPPPNFTPIETSRNDQSYYRQVPRSPQRSPQSFNAQNHPSSYQIRSPPVQARSPNIGQQQTTNIPRSANIDRLQVPYSPRYDRSPSLLRNPQDSPLGVGSYNQPTPSYYRRDEIASGQYEEIPAPHFERFPQSAKQPRVLRTPLPTTFSNRTPDHSMSKPDVLKYGYPQTHYFPVQRSVPSIKYQRSPVRKVSPNRQYMMVPRMEQQPVYSRGTPPVEGFTQRTPQSRQVGKSSVQGYAQSPRLTQRRESEQRSSNMREASLGRQEQLTQSNVVQQGYAGTGIQHKIFSRPTSSITKKPYRFNPPEQQSTETLGNRNESQRRTSLPVRQPVMSRPQPATKVSRIQKPSQPPSLPTGKIPRISPKKASPPRNIEADLGQSFQEFVSHSAGVSKQDIDEFNQSKLNKIQENTPNTNAASRAIESAARKKTLEKKAAMQSIRKRQEEAKVKHETQRAKAAKITEAKRIAKSLGSALKREEIMALVREENKDVEAAANSGEVLPSGSAPKDINSRAKILKMKGSVRPPPEKKSVLRKAKVDKEPDMSNLEGSAPPVAEDPKKLASIMITLEPVLEKTSPVLEKSLATGTPSSVAKLAVKELSKNMDDLVAMMSLERGTLVEPMPSTSTYQPTGMLQTGVVKKLFSPEKESDIDHEKLENLEKMAEVAEELFLIRDLSKFGDSDYEHSLLELEETLDIPDPDAPTCDICKTGTTKNTLRVQLRGSQPPAWFPGYLTVLPQSNPSRFMLSRTLSLPMAQAWKATEPEYYPNESQIMV